MTAHDTVVIIYESCCTVLDETTPSKVSVYRPVDLTLNGELFNFCSTLLPCQHLIGNRLGARSIKPDKKHTKTTTQENKRTDEKQITGHKN